MPENSYYRYNKFLNTCLCCVGLILSTYAYYVEFKKEHDSSFVALCDISSRMSCSKIFTSRYGKGFGIVGYITGEKHWLNQPNSVFGGAFYVFQFWLGLTNTQESAIVQVFASCLANMGSLYLGYILAYVLEDFCIVCVSTYVVNFLLLLNNIVKMFHYNRKRNQKVK